MSAVSTKETVVSALAPPSGSWRAGLGFCPVHCLCVRPGGNFIRQHPFDWVHLAFDHDVEATSFNEAVRFIHTHTRFDSGLKHIFKFRFHLFISLHISYAMIILIQFFFANFKNPY